MNGTNQKANNETKLNFWFLKIISFLSLLYFIAIPLGWVKQKLETADVIIFAIILLVNSELLERLVKLVISKDGITFDLDKIKAEQDSQQVKIETNKANIEATTNIVQRLTFVEQEMAKSKNQNQLIVSSLLGSYELKHLRKLASDEPFSYKKQRPFVQELRHLRALGFIENLPNKTISSMPENGNLKDYLQITEQGREHLIKREQAESEDNNSFDHAIESHT
ncbi:MAG: hypothetical protein KME46_02960 [Brasilonema angustatum HA4187-MV1]|jgi:hypothetical protein|nr:hypothetical protein [Brasilonema angustatum HA4187-MV1]